MRGYSAIGLYAPKYTTNVGGAMRAAHCYKASLIVVEGKRYSKYGNNTDTTAAYKHIPIIHGKLLDCVPVDCQTIAVECIESALALPKFQHPERAFYIFGPEDGSIPLDIRANCNYIVKIPTQYCMNLASTVNVVLYDRLAKGLK